MGDIIDDLQRLQLVELKLAAIRAARKSKSRQVEIKKRKVQDLEERLEANERLARDLQMRIDAVSLDVSAREESLNNHRRALNKAKTNKEYAAILSALNTEKADTTKIESSGLQLMEQLQNMQAARMDIEKEHERLSQEMRSRESTLKEFDAQKEAELKDLGRQREAYAAEISPQTVATFTRVAHRHDGEAMAAVEKAHPKRDDFICMGCHMKITLEIVNALQTRHELQTCDGCGRILFIESTVKQHS